MRWCRVRRRASGSVPLRNSWRIATSSPSAFGPGVANQTAPQTTGTISNAHSHTTREALRRAGTRTRDPDAAPAVAVNAGAAGAPGSARLWS